MACYRSHNALMVLLIIIVAIAAALNNAFSEDFSLVSGCTFFFHNTYSIKHIQRHCSFDSQSCKKQWDVAPKQINSHLEKQIVIVSDPFNH